MGARSRGRRKLADSWLAPALLGLLAIAVFVMALLLAGCEPPHKVSPAERQCERTHGVWGQYKTGYACLDSHGNLRQ
jgi:hypothetical protein